MIETCVLYQSLSPGPLPFANGIEHRHYWGPTVYGARRDSVVINSLPLIRMTRDSSLQNAIHLYTLVRARDAWREFSIGSLYYIYI